MSGTLVKLVIVLCIVFIVLDFMYCIILYFFHSYIDGSSDGGGEIEMK